MIRDATFDPSGRHRLLLVRQEEPGLFGTTPSTVVFMMLNPSKAGKKKDDPTVTQCLGFMRLWGHTRLLVVNLFSLIATDPAELATAPDRVHPGNDEQVALAVGAADRLVVAWGAHSLARPRAVELAPLLGEAWSLGTTKDGSPRHPLRLARATPLVRWSVS